MIGGLGDLPGIDWFRLYEAVVVNNMDPMRNCRVQFRVNVIMDNIPDHYLSWAIPFTDYSVGENANYGKVDIPPIGAKILVAFQNASPLHPIYMGYCVDQTTQMYEILQNYPNRKIFMWPNKAMMLIDTKTNEFMFRNMGDAHLYVMGNVDLTVNGNLTERVFGDREVYVEGNSTEFVKGTSTRQSGTVSDFVTGDKTETIQGKQQTHVVGDRVEVVTGNHETYAEGHRTQVTGQNSHSTVGGGSYTRVTGDDITSVGNNAFVFAGTSIGSYAVGRVVVSSMPVVGSEILLQPSSPAVAPAAPAAPAMAVPSVPEWTGVRWDQPKDKNV